MLSCSRLASVGSLWQWSQETKWEWRAGSTTNKFVWNESVYVVLETIRHALATDVFDFHVRLLEMETGRADLMRFSDFYSDFVAVNANNEEDDHAAT